MLYCAINIFLGLQGNMWYRNEFIVFVCRPLSSNFLLKIRSTKLVWYVLKEKCEEKIMYLQVYKIKIKMFLRAE